MIKKILFLLTFLLTTLGGGQLWAVDTRTFTSATVPDHGTTETIGNISITFGSSSSTFSGVVFDETKYGLQGTKNTGADLDNHIPKPGENFYLNLSTYYPGRMSVNFYNSDSKDPRGITCYRQSTSDNSVTFVGSIDASVKSMGTLEFDMEPGYNYYVYSVSGAPIYHEISFTPEAKTNSVDYSHTWLFEYDTKWPNTVGAMLTANNKWDTNGFEGRYQYMGIVNTSGGDALYDGNGNLVEETRGLKFSATNASDIQTELHYNLMLRNGASVIIPSAKIGQTVSIRGWWPKDKTISVINAKTSDNANSVTGTGAVAEFVFTVTANADVTITVGDDRFFFYSISINKSELTTFAHNINGNETFYGLSTPSSGKIGGAFIGKTTTFQYKVGRDQVLRTRVDIEPGLDVTGITVNSTNFTLTSDNNNNILDPTSCYVSSYDATTYHKFNYGSIKVKKPGTASLTYRFKGTDAYNAKDYTELFTIEKDDIDLKFASDFVVKTVGEPAFTNTFKLNGLTLPVADDNVGSIDTNSFTYKVTTADNKNTSYLVSVDGNGQVTLSSTPGVVNIHVKHDATDYYNGVDRSYRLVVNPSSGTTPTLQWNDGVSSTSISYNNAATHVATETTSTGQNIKYRSANNSIASVDAEGKVTGTGIGTTTIYAYIEPTETNKYAEITYTVEVTSAGELTSFRFAPNEGKVNNGKSITPKLAFPTIPGDGVTSLKVTKIQVLERNGISVSESALTADDAIAACDIIGVDNASNLKDNWILNADGKVNKVNVTINGKTVGKAEITVTFTSTYYSTATATYTIEVTDASKRNFSWADESPEYYTYAGDFMMLPAIRGNSNGNNNYSNGAKNSASYSEGGTSYSALQKYKYDIKNGTITWNKKDIKIGEGFPDFEIVTDGISNKGTASVFFGRGEGGNHPDTLMVFCETAGDVKLRAYDPQDHDKYCDAIIHILPISNIEGKDGSATTVTNGMTYPYTWDFTTNFDMSVVGETDRYWIPIKDNSGKPTGDYTNGYGFFNLDWADTNTNGKTDDRFYKYFIAGAGSSETGYMHEFNGMMLKLKGSTSWANKMDRMRILAYDNTNQKGRLQFNGGYHTMKLFLPGEDKRPSDFKIFVKASGAGGHVCIMGTDEKEVSGTVKTLSSGAAIYSFDFSDVTSASDGYILMGFEDAHVYWIAMSTEEKNLSYFKHSNSHLTYAAAAYSYPEDLDLSKSNEVNGATAYYASSFTKDNDAQGAYSNEPEQQYAVVMSPLSNLGTYVTSGTGMLLKYDEVGGITADTKIPFYMIANPKNVATYKADPTIDGTTHKNYLVGTGATTPTIGRTTEIGGTTYTNFMMSAAYKYYTDITNENTAQGGYRFDRDWSFYPVMNNTGGSVDPQKSYLRIPGNLYVNKEGKIVDIPASSRSYGRAADNDTPGAPASRGALSIVFDDDPSNGQGTTGISTVATEITNDSDAWFTLQGVRVNAPAKGGIYIHKGRKIVVK